VTEQQEAVESMASLETKADALAEQKPFVAQTELVKENAEPVRKRRIKHTVHRAGEPIPTSNEHARILSRTKAPEESLEEAVLEKAASVAQALAQEEESPEKSSSSFHDLIAQKANDIRVRNQRTPTILEGQGIDTFQIGDRLLKSVFEDDTGRPLPTEQRQEIMRNMQQGKIKRHWR
jgi:hypothetical protein